MKRSIFGRNVANFAGKTLHEIQKIAGLAWDAVKLPGQYTFNGELKTDRSEFKVVRRDTGEAIGSVGTDYSILQNSELFGIISRLREFHDIQIIDAGSWGGGSSVFVQAKINGIEALKLNGRDVTDPFFTFSNSHDGSTPFHVSGFGFRTICENALPLEIARDVRVAIAKKWNDFARLHSVKAIRAKHTANMEARINEARAEIEKRISNWSTMMAVYSRMTEKKADEEMLSRIVAGTFGEVKEDASAKAKTARAKIEAEISAIFESVTCAKTSGKTVWTAYQAALS